MSRHNFVPLASLEPVTPQSQVWFSTTKPLLSSQLINKISYFAIYPLLNLNDFCFCSQNLSLEFDQFKYSVNEAFKSSKDCFSY